YDALVKEKLSAGSHFAAAREAAIGELLGNNYGGELSGSNNILAVEYLKALTRLSSDITFKTISRIGGAHDDIAPGEFVSAMQIRKQLHMGSLPFGTVPSSTLREIAKHEEEGHCPASFQPIERAVLAKLRTMSAAEFATLPDISEGLENKLLKAVKTADSLKTLYATMKSKRYSHARMRRLVLHAFLGISADSQKLHYIKILGMTQRGEGIIKKAKPDLPLIGKSTEIYKLSKTAQKCFAAEAQADDLYGLTTPQILPCGLTYTKKIIKT
ncbi:MAG: nucleotidyltransferase family protein, partial [Oscillospiraceae bacterium]